MQLRRLFALDAKALIFGEMPVKDIQLYGSHRVEISFEHFHRLEMSPDIDQQSAPWKARLIFDLNTWQEISPAIGIDQLQQSLETTKRANYRWRSEQRLAAGDVDTITFVLGD